MKKLVLSFIAAVSMAISFIPSAFAFDYSALRCVMETHPQWPSVTDEDMLVWLNTSSVETRPTDADPRVMWDVIVARADYGALIEAERDQVRTTLFGGGNHAVDISDNNTPAVKMFIRVFSGTGTLGALDAAFTETVTPVDNAGITGCCHLGDVQNGQLATCPQ